MTAVTDTIINATLSMGDAGWPLDVNIHVWYIEDRETILVTDCEDDSMFDNPPLNWSDRINEVIEDHFSNKKVEYIIGKSPLISKILKKWARGGKMDYLVRNDSMTALQKLTQPQLIEQLLNSL